VIADDQIVKSDPSRWLILPVEAKVREFDAKVFLGCLAVERGYSVLLGHYDVVNRWSGCLPRGVILEKNISVRYKSWLSRLRSSGYHFCVSDEEGLGLFMDPDIWFRIRMNDDMVHLVDYVFAWSEQHAEIIQRKYPDQTEKVVAVGTPRVDLLRKEMRGLYDQEVAQLSKRFGKYILMPSNFAAVINVRGDDYTIQQMWRHGYIKDKDEEKTFLDGLIHERTNLKTFVDALKRIRKEFPGHALVVRPHPIDRHEFWHKAVEAIDNAHVVYEGSITPWLQGADAIFHCGCSTGMEARIMERCSVSYHPHMDKRFDNLPSTDIGPVAHDEDALIAFIRQAIAKSGDCELDRGDVERYICSLDGKFAGEKMLDAIDSITMPDIAMNLTWYNPRAVKVRLHEWYRGRRAALRSKRADAKRRSEQKWPGASIDEARALVSSYNKLTGRFAKVGVKQVANDLFYMS
jgi:surface carbohydrate biosynthesis protein